MKIETKVFVADFETTVYEGQDKTEVWAAAIVELNTEDVHVFNSLQALLQYIESFKFNSIVYFHNIKFDGEFIIHYLLTKTNYKQCFIQPDPTKATGYFKEKRDMKDKEFRYSISGKGLWYSILLRNGLYFIDIRDSLKLLPFKVQKIGEDFKTKHQKTEIEYTGYRYAGGVITDEEKEYISNDVLVVKEAIEIMYEQGHKSLTIGACCFNDFKDKCCPFYDFNESCPNLYEVKIDKETFGSPTAGDYIRNSYHGGWCYVVDGKKNKIYHNGTTADVNSLYPSMMHSESGNRYPIGLPQFWIGNYIPDEAKRDDMYYFIRIKTQFQIKPKYLPCIQIKDSPFYRATEWLKTSDIHSLVTGEYCDGIRRLEGDIVPARPILTLTQTDFELIMEHYNLYNCEILDGCYFRTAIGIFDEYINKYKKIKMNSKGAIREIAKLFLNQQPLW